MLLQEIRRLTQELRMMEDIHFELSEELGRVIQSGEGSNFKIVWVYDKDPIYPTANLYIVCSEDEEFIKNLEFGISDEGIFCHYEEFKYYDSDGIEIKTPKDIYVTMMDFADWKTAKIDKEGKMKQVKTPKEVQRIIPVRIKGKILNLLEME